MIRILITLLLTTAAIQASPFLVCDPYPTAGIDQSLIPVSFNITGFGTSPISSLAFTQPDGTVILHYDVGPLSNGQYTVSVTAQNTL